MKDMFFNLLVSLILWLLDVRIIRLLLSCLERDETEVYICKYHE